ncbi:MAG TPA: glycosyltransferase [Terriglobales bacterium]|nr:glycosyltransferase [Terriglobales bacterium]
MPGLLQLVHGIYPEATGGVEIYAREVEQTFGGSVYVTGGGIGDWQRALDEAMPDVVLVQHLGKMNPAWLLDLRERGIPYAVFLHDFTALCPTHKLWHRREERCSGPGWSGFKCAWCVSGSLRRAAELPLRAVLYRHRPQDWRTALLRAEVIIANSRFTRDFFIDEGAPADRIVVIAPVLPAVVPSARSVVQSRMSSAGEGRRLLYCGGWGQAKGAELLAAALDEVRPGLQLTVAGRFDESARRAMRSAVSDRHVLDFTGELAPRAMTELISGCTAVVVPSRWEETYSRVAFEAQRAGVSVAATAVGGLSERIIHGVNGFLAAPDDMYSLADAIEEALQAAHSDGWNAALVAANAALDAEAALVALGRIIRQESGRESGMAPGIGRREQMELNHALAFFRGAGCRTVVVVDGEEGDELGAHAFFERWGVAILPEGASGGAAAPEGILALDEWRETAELRRLYPSARALVRFTGAGPETSNL